MQDILHKIVHETAKHSEIAAKTNKRPPSEIAAKINIPLSYSKLIDSGMCPIFGASMRLQVGINKDPK